MSLASRTHESMQPLQKLARFESLGEGTELLLEAFEPFGITGFAGWMALNPNRIDLPGSVISNWPGDWLRSYIGGKFHSYDPVVKRALERPGHFFWHDLESDGSPAAMKLMQDAAAFGLVDGFTLSWRCSGQVATFLSLSGGPLEWSSLEIAVAAAMADTFLLRGIFIRDRKKQPRPDLLTPQERRLLHCAASGLTDHEIAQQLGIARGTVQTHWQRTRLKLGATSRTQAVARGLTMGQIAY